jgi:hypothetical protein
VWSLFVQSLTAFLTIATEIPQAGSGPINKYSDHILSVNRQFRFQKYPCDPALISVMFVMFGQLHKGLMMAFPNQF